MKEPRIKAEVRGEGWCIPIFECEWCGGDMQDWIELPNGEFICPSCAFKKGKITDKEYIDMEVPDIFKKNTRAVVEDQKIYIAIGGEKVPWERTNKDYRQSKEYAEWRSEVFERDGYKCQLCGQIGGNLNAHHIRPFKDYPDLRFDLNNGITLCEKCHRSLHKRIREYARKTNVHEEDNGE